MRAVVVGNGPVEARLGNVINSFDCVIRINYFEIAGYEHLIGNKTNFICCHTNCDPTKNECEKVWYAQPPSYFAYLYQKDMIRYLDQWKGLQEKKKLVIFNGSFWKSFEKAYPPIFTKIKSPTTGFVAIHYALYLGYDVSIIGFNGGKGGHLWMPSDNMFAGHDWDYEFKQLKILNKKLKIKFLELKESRTRCGEHGFLTI